MWKWKCDNGSKHISSQSQVHKEESTVWDMSNKKTEMPETDTKAVEVNAFLTILTQNKLNIVNSKSPNYVKLS